jgi:hypothetical protein
MFIPAAGLARLRGLGRFDPGVQLRKPLFFFVRYHARHPFAGLLGLVVGHQGVPVKHLQGAAIRLYPFEFYELLFG